MREEDYDDDQQRAACEDQLAFQNEVNKMILDMDQVVDHLMQSSVYLSRFDLDDARCLMRLQRAQIDRIIRNIEQMMGGIH